MRQTAFTDDTQLTMLQQSLNDQFGKLQHIPFLNGNLIAGVSLLSGDNIINHKLGKLASGYFITSLNANTPIWQSGLTTTTITLSCTANCTISVWVF